MNKLSKTAKIISLLLNILCWTVLAGGLFHGYVSTMPLFADLSGKTTLSGITLDYLKLYAGNGGIPVVVSALKEMAVPSLFVYFLEVPLMCYGLQLLRRVLKPMAEQRPFSGTGKTLRKLGVVSLAIALIENGTDYWLHFVIEHSYDLERLFQGSLITDVDFLFQIDYTFLLAAAVFFLLSGVFRYGEELQQLSDETL